MENRIRRLRKMQGLTLEKLGEKTGINITSLSHYETCKREPRLETWKILADAFNVSIPYLQGLTNIDLLDDSKYYTKKEAIDCVKRVMKTLGVTKKDLI